MRDRLDVIVDPMDESPHVCRGQTGRRTVSASRLADRIRIAQDEFDPARTRVTVLRLADRARAHVVNRLAGRTDHGPVMGNVHVTDANHVCRSLIVGCGYYRAHSSNVELRMTERQPSSWYKTAGTGFRAPLALR